MKIGIVGLGFVGLSLASVLGSKNYRTVGIDVDKEKCEEISNGRLPFFEPDLDKTLRIALKKKLTIGSDFSMIDDCDLIFVCVGTPQVTNGAIDLSMIRKAIKSIGEIIPKNKKNPVIIIKSTVVPGTIKDVILPILEKESHKKAGKDFGLISNPEFLQESNAIKDTKFPHAIVLGRENKDRYLSKVKKFLIKLHPKIPIVITNHQTAEMIKYANNSFLATKISFINQLSNICQNIPGANIDDIAKTIGLDPRIGKLFLNAGPGYGGSCLPKDMKALINFANNSGVNPTLLNAVEKTNSKQLEKIISTIEKKLGSISTKKITILGTAFKPNTDDIRDSISIEIIKRLLKKKASIIIYDPKAMKNTKKIFSEKISYAGSVNNALEGSQCVVIITRWKQFESLDNKKISLMKKKVVIDCRRALINKKLNADYFALGIGK